ncbi:hypothetical protein IID22_00920 [Patescibacteria group bacterium]|nr:hypothetical protein [Patescibacteria group bacterium]
MAKQDFGLTSYIFGVVSVVLAFFQPLAGFVFGLIGLSQSKKQKGELSEKARKLSIAGIVISIILFALSAFLAFRLASGGLGLPGY